MLKKQHNKIILRIFILDFFIDDILDNLRQNHAIKLRNAASFGLPGWVRLRCMPPESQEHLSQAWVKILNTRNANR